jgi:hypothetical protein
MSGNVPPARPSRPPDGDLRIEDVVSQLTDHYGPTLFLGVHTTDDTRVLLENHGIPDRLQDLGFDPLHLEIHPLTSQGQTLRLYDQKSDPDRLLMEFRLRIGEMAPALKLATEVSLPPLRMLRIEWLVLQNPRAEFVVERPRLPEQQHPGLGMGAAVGAFLEELAHDHRCDGILSFPQHYHNAVIYGRRYVFFHPSRQGTHEAMLSQLRERTLADRSFAIDAGFLVDERRGKAMGWEASEMVRPLSRRMAEMVHSRFWRREVRRCRKIHRWRIDWERYDEKVKGSEGTALKER